MQYGNNSESTAKSPMFAYLNTQSLTSSRVSDTSSSPRLRRLPKLSRPVGAKMESGLTIVKSELTLAQRDHPERAAMTEVALAVVVGEVVTVAHSVAEAVAVEETLEAAVASEAQIVVVAEVSPTEVDEDEAATGGVAAIADVAVEAKMLDGLTAPVLPSHQLAKR